MQDLDVRSEPYKLKNLRWLRFKKFTITLLDRAPLLKMPILRAWRTCKWALLRCKWKIFNVSQGENGLDRDRTYYVCPRKIKYCSLKEFSLFDYRGRTIGGNWDLLEKEFDKLDIYIALREVCINGKDWQEMTFYQRILDRLTKGEVLWNCTNKLELDKRCKNLKSLYYRIKQGGYKEQAELIGRSYNPIKNEDEVTVSIGRFGDLLFSNGAHRLAIAKLLGIKKIPVKIAVRHPQWVNFRKEILSCAKEQKGKIYQTLTHPDLSDIPFFHLSMDRFQMIKDNLISRKGLLLDIGANWGYFCHKFEELGFECYAVENSLENQYFLNKLKRAENRNFKIIPKSVLEWDGIFDIEFNVVIALNIFHHFLKTKISYHKFINLLRNTKMKEMFFEPHLPTEKQMLNSYKNYSIEEFISFIKNYSRLRNVKCIGKASDGRGLYRLY